MGWSSIRGLAQVGGCEGSCAFPGEVLNDNSIGLLMSLSELTCG
jgi:hypothetical protein